jgi:hypothetical protein
VPTDFAQTIARLYAPVQHASAPLITIIPLDPSMLQQSQVGRIVKKIEGAQGARARMQALAMRQPNGQIIPLVLVAPLADRETTNANSYLE